jgi:hypothetical protein
MTMMKAFCAATAMTLAASDISVAADDETANHRYLIERTFPAGVLDGVDAAAKKKVNDNNATLRVNWEKSYANADKTKTYCVYTAPNEDAVREAARLNGLPVDSITEIPEDIKAEPMGAVHEIPPGKRRYLVRRAGSTDLNAAEDSRYGVKLLTSYATADNSGSFWVYQAPDLASVEKAARASGVTIESIAEIPETLYPR